MQGIALAPLQPMQNVPASQTGISPGGSNAPAGNSTSSSNNSTGTTAQTITNARVHQSQLLPADGSANIAVPSKEPGFWEKCNNLYMAIAVATGLVISVIGFKVAFNSYFLALWTSKKDFIELCIEMQAARDNISNSCKDAISAGLSAPPVLRPRELLEASEQPSPRSYEYLYRVVAMILAVLVALTIFSHRASIMATIRVIFRYRTSNRRPHLDFEGSSVQAEPGVEGWVPTATARAWHGTEADELNAEFIQAIRHRRVARSQFGTSESWNSLNPPDIDSQDGVLEESLVNRIDDSNRHTSEEEDDTSWLPVRNYVPTVPYLEELFRIVPHSSLETQYATSKVARVIYFYAVLIQYHLNQPTRFFVSRVDTDASESQWTSSQGSWTINYADPDFNISEETDWKPLQQAFTDLLTFKIGNSAVQSEMVEWTVNLPTRACSMLEVHMREAPGSQSEDQVTKDVAGNELAKDLAARYALIEPFEQVKFVNLSTGSMDFDVGNMPHILILVGCDEKAFQDLLDEVHSCFQPRATWQPGSNEHKWLLQSRRRNSQINVSGMYEVCAHELGAAISHDLQDLGVGPDEAVQDLLSADLSAMDRAAPQVTHVWQDSSRSRSGAHGMPWSPFSTLDVADEMKLAIWRTGIQPSRGDLKVLREGFIREGFDKDGESFQRVDAT